MNDVTMLQPLRFAGKPSYKTLIPFQVVAEKGGEFEVHMLTLVDWVKLWSAETGEEVRAEVKGLRVKVVGNIKRGLECYGVAFGDSLERSKILQALRETEIESEQSVKAEPVKVESMKREVKL